MLRGWHAYAHMRGILTRHSKKVAIDQFVQAPIFTAIIFVFFAVIEGRGLDAAR